MSQGSSCLRSSFQTAHSLASRRPQTIRKGTFGSPFFGLLARPTQDQLAFLIRLLLRHWVHTRIRLTSPSTLTRTVCRLGYHRRLVRLLAWLTLLPVTGPFAQSAHTRAISSTY